VIDDREAVVATSSVSAGTVSQKGLQRALDDALGALGIRREQAVAVAATGYGRRIVPGGTDFVFTEISAHARGVSSLFPGVQLVVDIGGQDTKAIRVDPDGHVEKFAMNDRCASGTGRFYEGLANALETDLADLDDLAARGTADLEISSLCATFAVTEVISLLAGGHAPPDIAASVHKAATARVLGLIGQVGKGSPVALTGGVALNGAVVRALTEALGEEVLIPADPLITGALGAALLASERLQGSPAPPTDSESRVGHHHAGSASCSQCGVSASRTDAPMLVIPLGSEIRVGPPPR
jgi:predicted CoA-substrate-specific enzyme activase